MSEHEDNPVFIELCQRPLAVLWTMAPTGEITQISDSILEVRGLTPAEAMAQSADQILTTESMTVSLSYFEQFNKWLLAGETPEAFHAELDYFHKDGHIVKCEVMSVPIFGDDGSVIELRGVSSPLFTDL